MVLPAVFAIMVGVGMVGQWTVSYMTRQIPELQTEPIRIWFHITAEMVTALCLVVSGVALLTLQAWSVPLYLVASGMLFYTVIVSPGYFAQKGQWGWLVMFSVILILGIVGVLQIL